MSCTGAEGDAVSQTAETLDDSSSQPDLEEVVVDTMKRRARGRRNPNAREQLRTAMQLYELDDIRIFWVTTPSFTGCH